MAHSSDRTYRPQPRGRNRDFTGATLWCTAAAATPIKAIATPLAGLGASTTSLYSKAKSTIRCKAVGARPELLLQSVSCLSIHGNRHLTAQHLDRLQCSLIDLKASFMHSSPDPIAAPDVMATPGRKNGAVLSRSS